MKKLELEKYLSIEDYNKIVNLLELRSLHLNEFVLYKTYFLESLSKVQRLNKSLFSTVTKTLQENKCEEILFKLA